ncbi:hypothetical protein GCM10012275_56490 [Longimycelium tulufanense]|uniref:PD-(D/E)XK endonuclease-like domain-containing protein n=1 Tax=Longimycelium tulufanense TaxID=907463 RepID=A0A8J3CKR7_9PSEU|nr:hypothetical protein [Longimycelium tulufanense]GGM78570.1 hypothetical protein GCM10012275_56490 [Longimycelium tulufanense]
MTTPKIRTVSRGGSRFYIHPTSADRVPGVTSIIGMLPKPFLTAWAAKLTAETAVDLLGEVVGIALRDKQAAVDMLKRAPRRFTEAAADVGTEVHELCEHLSRGDRIGRVHPDLRPYVDGYQEFLDEFQPEFLELEATLWSDTHRYAGSCDWIAKIGDEIVIGDNKTTRSGVHEEVALQLTAYAFADYFLRPDGTQDPIPKIEAGAVVHLRPDEDDPSRPRWQLVPVRVDESVFDVFLTLRRVFEWDKDIKATVLGEPVNSAALARLRRGRKIT